MHKCPRFDRCSATKCPLDPDHLLRRHLPGDGICEFLKRHVKEENLCDLQEEIISAVLDYYDYLYSPRGRSEKGLHDIRRRLSRASLQPIKIIPWDKSYE